MSVMSSVSTSSGRSEEGGERESSFAAAWRALVGAVVGLWRSPRYALPALASLALGLGAATAVFAVFSALVLRPLPFPEEERLVRVGFPGAAPVLAPEELALSAPFLRDYQQLNSVFEGVETERSWAGRLEIGQRALRVGPQLVSRGFFDMLGVQALEGRLFTARGPSPDGFDVIVLREGFWRRELGGAPVVGKTLRYEGRPVKVLGILRDDQAIPCFMDVWIPENQAEQTQRMHFMGRGIARLAKGVTLEAARARLAEVSKDAGVRTPSGSPLTAQLRPLRESLVQPQRAWIALLLAAVIAFLLLAAANVSALLATRASARAHEWAVRRALGSSAWGLVRQSALDAGLIGVLGAALGFVLAHFAVELANREYYEVIGNTPARLDARVVTACVLATLICALAGALAPLLTLRRIHPADALRGEGRSTEKPRARRLRQALLIFQVAVTSVLLINAGLIIRSVRSLLAVDAGFSSRDVVTAGITLPLEPIGKLSPEERQRAFEARTKLVIAKARAVLERLRRMRGAAHATVTIDVPFDFHSWPVRLLLPAPSTQQEVTAIVHFVGPGYFETLGTRLLSGTDFGDEITVSERPVCMVSHAFARALGVRDAVGRHLRWRDAGPPPGLDLEIIGMVEDTIEDDLTAPPPLQLYVPFAAGALSVSGPTIAAFQVALRGDDPAALARELPLTIKEVLPDAALSGTRRMDEWVNKSFWQRSALSHVLSALALAAGVLSAIGLFGITSFTVNQRTGEVGIRRALGATRGAVLSLVLFETLRLVAIGALLGAVASWFSRQLLAAFLFGIAPLDPLTYVAVGIGVAFVALLAALAPALAASRVNPTHALTWR